MTGHIAKAVRFDVVADEYQQHAGHCARRCCIDSADVGMRGLRTHHDGVRHVLKLGIVGIAAPASN
jgi:hypothetical protein